VVHAEENVVLFSPVARDFRGTARRVAAPGPPGRARRIVHIVVLFIASVVVADGLIGDRGLFAMLRARQEYENAAATIAQLRADNARLREQVRRLREDPAAIEEVARRELGLIKPGETVFIIKDVPPSKP
jgi:cell division protein FtsB